MSGFDRLLLLLQGVTVWDGIKWLMVLGLGLYAVFAVVAVRQVQLMSRTIDGALKWQIKLLTLVHLGIAVGALMMAVVIL
ncbi:MAG: hypothetical protein A2784_00155 [Candidatus Chisholmbacteria bacterium RIFCSPHIGHO2_01_FULL_48_12]|uniref:Copper resistance protein D domain-containing protein n=1 Tax=Candidatus Chisholmbacteria bacterium RIFCSPHIGHO2_01_FULL_48_12 TaxID=1797589 RepID=A0A1G1VKZ3_9BACT|nr:MAG: hypothetical protein A2784_00155 [Candidatus Chisholmbacteria bacterium RIFCSPHIGHO2_01_FULL_48_12]